MIDDDTSFKASELVSASLRKVRSGQAAKDVEANTFGQAAHDALREIQVNLEKRCQEVYDADLKGYFDTIPHNKLMLCLKVRVTARSVLNLIEMWLEIEVEEDYPNGNRKVTKPKQGTPQGGVISPLLSNA